MRCRRLAVTTVVAVAVVVVHAAAGPSGLVGKAARRDAIARAEVWMPTDVAAMDVRAGPAGPGAFAPDELVTCTYTPHERRGGTPKFHCTLPDGDEVKVKYGVRNGEVYGAVLATRLLWALGFGADRQYPVRVLCYGCSGDPWDQTAPTNGSHLFEIAAIERSFAHRLIETRDGSGWKWAELGDVDAAAGGAPAGQRDALRLLAVMLQHTDSKPEQQRIVCLDPRGSDADPGRCEHPFMYVHDVGLTFGAANTWNRNNIGSTNLERWAREPVWSDVRECIGNLRKSATGSLENPRIGEAGRALLASLLSQLTDAQLRDLFTVARIERRTPDATVGDWIVAFKHKRDEISSARCAD